jgi:hypothetical protein
MLCSLRNPEFGWIPASNIIASCVAEGGPLGWDDLAQERQDFFLEFRREPK